MKSFDEILNMCLQIKIVYVLIILCMYLDICTTKELTIKQLLSVYSADIILK